jgi:hypothetical protein
LNRAAVALLPPPKYKIAKFFKAAPLAPCLSRDLVKRVEAKIQEIELQCRQDHGNHSLGHRIVEDPQT